MIRWCDNPEMADFMTKIIPGKSENEIRAAFYEKYGITLSKGQIKGFKCFKHVPSGTVGGRFEKGHVPATKGKKMSSEQYERLKSTMFKKGHTPKNHKPVGSERVSVYGYVEIKIAEPNKWALKQRVVWEQHYNEKLTSNDAIVFLDGNSLNLSIDNLIKVTRSELARLNQDGLICGDPEKNLVAINIAKIKARTRKRRKSAND